MLVLGNHTIIVRVAQYMLIVTYIGTQTIVSHLALSQIQIGLLPSAFGKFSSPNNPKNCLKSEPALGFYILVVIRILRIQKRVYLIWTNCTIYVAFST